MQQFDLEEYLKNTDRQIVTKDGRRVKIICMDMKAKKYPIVAMIENDGNKEFSMLYAPDGISGNGFDSLNLYFAPTKKEGWINVRKYKEDTYVVGKIYDNEKEAKEDGWNRSAMTIKIKWEE